MRNSIVNYKLLVKKRGEIDETKTKTLRLTMNSEMMTEFGEHFFNPLSLKASLRPVVSKKFKKTRTDLD